MSNTPDQEKVWRSADARPLGLESMEFGQIVSIMRQRRTMDSRLIRGMIAVRDRYNGDIVVPLPDVKNSPAMAPPVPNLVIEAIDNLAMRANSTMPRITSPPRNPESESSRARAETKRRALYGRWHSSQLNIKRFRAFRHFVGYGTFAMITMFDEVKGHAVVELRDPLTAYPELRAPDDIREPKNVGFIFARSVDWIRAHYPVAASQFLQNAAGKSWDTLWDIVEWIDENEVVIGIMGPKIPAYGAMDARPYGYTAYELSRWKNKAGCVPVVCPRRVTLDRIQGQMTSMLGFNDTFGRATALDFVAMERSIFPDIVIIGANGAPPQIFSGEWHDGREGKANILANATVQMLERGPGPMSGPVLASMERAIRSSGGVGGGEDLAGQRTGAGVGALAAVTVDPRMQEAQEIMAQAHTIINTHIMATEKGYAPQQKYTIIPGLRGDMRSVTYVPEKDFEYEETVVDYPFAGLDVSQLSVAVTQLVGSELMSKRTGRSVHPMIDDGGQEEENIAIEQLDLAQLAGLSAQVQSGQMSPVQVAHIRQLMADGAPMYKAILESAAIAATNAPAPGTPGAPEEGEPSPPAGTPNPALPQGGQQMMAALGAGGAAPPPTVPAPSAGMANSRKLLQSINENISPSAV